MRQAPAAAFVLVTALAAPASADAPDKAATAELYRLHCQSCHMADGDSPLEPLNFVDGQWKQGSEPDKVAAVIADGVPSTAMLAFKAKLTPAEIKALAEHVRAFDKSLPPPGKGNKKKK